MHVPKDGDLIRFEHDCPNGQTHMRWEMRLAAKPLGSFSLSGQQMKFSAVEQPRLTCDSCDAEFVGERE